MHRLRVPHILIVPVVGVLCLNVWFFVLTDNTDHSTKRAIFSDTFWFHCKACILLPDGNCHFILVLLCTYVIGYNLAQMSACLQWLGFFMLLPRMKALCTSTVSSIHNLLPIVSTSLLPTLIMILSSVMPDAQLRSRSLSCAIFSLLFAFFFLGFLG